MSMFTERYIIWVPYTRDGWDRVWDVYVAADDADEAIEAYRQASEIHKDAVLTKVVREDVDM